MTKDSLNMFLKSTYNIRFGKSASRKNSLGDSSQNVRVTDVRALSRKNRCSENFLEQRRLLLQNISQNIDFLKSPLKSLSNSQNDFSNRVFTNTHYNGYSGNQRNKSSISSRDVSRRIESNDIHSIASLNPPALIPSDILIRGGHVDILNFRSQSPGQMKLQNVIVEGNEFTVSNRYKIKSKNRLSDNNHSTVQILILKVAKCVTSKNFFRKFRCVLER